MTRVSKIAIAAVAVVGLAGAGIAVAAAAHGGPHGHGEFMRQRVIEHIDQVLDAAKATPEQDAANLEAEIARPIENLRFHGVM